MDHWTATDYQALGTAVATGFVGYILIVGTITLKGRK